MGKPVRSTFEEKMNNMVTTLRQEITSGVYGDGEFLPPESVLIERFFLSKNSVRKALDLLLKEGLIVKIPRVGTQVTLPLKKVVIRFFVYPSTFMETDLVEIISEFQERFPTIQVETLELPATSAEALVNLVRLGIVDVLTLNVVDYQYFRDMASLSLLEKQSRKEDTYPFLNMIFSDQREGLFAQPFVFSPVILCYNKNHLRSKRLLEPNSGWSWEDLRELVRNLKAPNHYGIDFNLLSPNRWPIFLLQNGVQFERDSAGNLGPVEANSLTELRLLREFIHEDGVFPLAVSLGDHNPEILFKQQRVSVMLTTYYRLNDLKDVDFEYDISQLPRARNNNTLLLCTGIAVSANSTNKEAALTLANYLSSESVQRRIRTQTLTLPANKRWAETDEVALEYKPSRLELHREMIPNYVTLEHLNLSNQEIRVLGECLKPYFTKLVDEQGLLKLFNDQLRAKAK